MLSENNEMIIENTKINGVKIIISEPFRDDRGFFNRIFCQKELHAIHPNIEIAQINHSMTIVKGTIRGMHFQHPPHAEMKIIRCIRGSIFDVAVDLRKNSPTVLQWHGEILSAENMKALIVPEGCAHGFQALDDSVEMIYIHTTAYYNKAEEAVRYNDPKINIQWPLKAVNVSEKDMSYQLLSDDWQGIIL
jgi:dTDP-4-dehydrorhamnose 3,5-epimerase